MNSPGCIPFVKASACGNDFLLIDAREMEGKIPASTLADFSRTICDRHNGVGADGVEWMYPAATGGDELVDVEIRLINADGSEAEISGNGTRCVAAHICASERKEKISILTGAGLKHCTLKERHGNDYKFETEMGRAVVGGEAAVKLERGDARGISVSMGNPHFVMFAREFAADWQGQAAEIQRSPGFKQGVNVEMVVVEGPHDINVRFFERGAGETQSSGTGSCAAAAASVWSGLAEYPVKVHAAGGTQVVRQEINSVYLLGPARLVCRGEFFSGE